jgi:hypothetical protein
MLPTMDKTQSRRRRVAMRQLKRCPLFAVEFMQSEFPDYDESQFFMDIQRKGKKQATTKSAKNPLTKFGRYAEMTKSLNEYRFSGDTQHLAHAQRMRNNMSKPYQIWYKKAGVDVEYSFPAKYSYQLIKKLAALRYADEQDLDNQIKELTKYEGMGG